MKHFVFAVQNGTTPAAAAYDNKADALAAYHTEMAYRHESRTSTTGIVVDAAGHVVAMETYTAPPAPVGGEEA